MSAKRDYYEILGLDKKATDASIKKAYRKLAKNIIRTLTPMIKKPRNDLKK